MIVKIVLFARAKELVGSESLELELDDDVSVGDLKRVLAEKYPAMLEILDHICGASRACSCARRRAEKGTMFWAPWIMSPYS